MEPKFSTYTLEELLDIESHIDKATYPERYQKVYQQILIKQREPEFVEKNKLKHKVHKARGVLYCSAFFWFLAFFTLLTGEFRIKGYSALYADNPIGFFCGFAIHFSCGFILYLMYIKQRSKLNN